MTKPHGGPAFPRPASIDSTSGTLPDGDRVVPEQTGMTLRDFFAAAALTGILSWSPPNVEADGDEEMAGNTNAGSAAEMAYDYADAMLARRTG